MNEKTKKEIEFNSGFITALVLFYGHLHQFQREEFKDNDFRIYTASDHLFNIEYPKNLDNEIKERIEKFRKKALEMRYKTISMKEGDDLFLECLEIAKMIDKKCFKLKDVVVNYI
ncbi:MAG: hypothetical protein OH319_05155 [Candidatus Parvarchaeota archaeon]|nr:hypothetical protein [Candidatus Jingweiarchaeum tengchongense]